MKQRIVFKVGTSLLSDGQCIQKEWMIALAKFIVRLREHFEIILVTSGAVASGYTQLPLNRSDLIHQRVLASLGQPVLFETYRKIFEVFGVKIAQILVCDKRDCKDTQTMMDTLLFHHILPILNENDAMPHQIFGNNDCLSAWATDYFQASLLVILSDIDGWFDKDPHCHSNAKLILKTSCIPAQKLQADENPYATFATGGIVTKLLAADFLLQRHKAMFLCNGRTLEVLESFLLYQVQTSGTLFGEWNG